MLLVIEVGNTNTSVGVYDGPRLLVSWRLTSRREQTSDEYGVFIQTLLRHPRHRDAATSRGVAISNVVPPVQRTLEWMCEAYFGITPFTVQPGRQHAHRPERRPAARGRRRPRVQRRGGHGALRRAAHRGGLRHGDQLRLRRRAGRVRRRRHRARADHRHRGAGVARGAAVPRRARPPGDRHRPQHRRRTSSPGSCSAMRGSSTGWSSASAPSSGGHAKVVATGGLAAQMHEVARSIQIVNADLRLEGLRMIWEQRAPGDRPRLTAPSAARILHR